MIKHIYSSKAIAQNGRGINPADRRALVFLPCLAARIRALCASKAGAHEGHGVTRAAPASGRFIRYLAAGAGLAALSLGAWALTTPVVDWNIAGPFGGTAITVAVDPRNPNTVLAGARNSLLFESSDFGGSWNMLNFPKRNLGEITAILVDPADSNHYLAGMLDAFGGGLYESRDQGKTWSAAPDINNVGVRALTAAPGDPTEFVAGTLNGVMLSHDAGKTWSRISDPNNLEMQGITAVAVDPNDANLIYAGTTHLPWKTTDAGKTWESIHSGMIDDSDVFSIYVDPQSPANVFASACSGIYSSLNKGNSWRKLPGIPNTSRRTHVIREDPSRSGIIYAGTTMGLFKSINAGLNWKTLTNTQVNALTFAASQPGTMYLALENEGIGKSENGGEAIQLVDAGFVDRQISSVAASGNKLVAIESQEGETTGIFVSYDNGVKWSHMANPRGLGGVHLRAIAGSFSEDRILLGSGTKEIYKSIDSGASWRPVSMRVVVNAPAEGRKPSAAGRGPLHPVKPQVMTRVISPSSINGLYSVKSGSQNLIFAATDLGLFKSADLGEQWSAAGVGLNGGVSALYQAAEPDGRLAARASSGLYWSDDFGDHWKALPFPLPTSDINDLAIAGDHNAPLLAATRLGLYSSPDGGSQWFANNKGIQASTVNSVVYQGKDRTAFAVEYGQLYQTDDGGNSWSPLPSALPGLPIRKLWTSENTPNRLFAIASGLGVLFRN